MSLVGIGSRIAKFTTDNSPAILTAVGVVGVVTTAYLTGKATLKAAALVQKEEAAREYDWEMGEHLTPVERVQVAWTSYIPAAGTAVITVAAIIAANRVNSKRVASVVTALAIGEKAFGEYKDKVVEKFGENKARTVRDSIAQDHVRDNPPGNHIVVESEGGQVLCRDEYSGRYFRGSVEVIRKAENDMNYKIIHDGDASLSEFYEMIGLSRTSPSDDLGWNQDHPLTIDFSTAMTEDSKPCVCFTFRDLPYPRFYKLG